MNNGPKMIKIDDDEEYNAQNIISIQENHLLKTSGKIWDSALILGKYLMKMNYFNESFLKNKQILELGCGTGILGIFMSCLGCQVLITDQGCVDTLCDINIKRNEKNIKEHKGNVQFRILDWDQEENKTFKYSLDKFEYSIILAADPIYDDKTFNSFFNILQQLYQHSKTPITYLAYKQRHPEIDKQIIIKLEDIGLWYKIIEFNDLDEQWRSKQIDVYQIGKF